MASPSIFASGVDHFRCVPEDVDVNDEDDRIAHCAERRSTSLGGDCLHRAAARSRLRECVLMSECYRSSMTSARFGTVKKFSSERRGEGAMTISTYNLTPRALLLDPCRATSSR
jgi:hypothetical protein